MSDARVGSWPIRPARPEDCGAVIALLETAALPFAGVEDWIENFVVAEQAGRIVGVAGLEVYGRDGLLRSVAVADDWRGRGIGVLLTTRVLDVARRTRLRSVYLLTETAEAFFPRFGFRRIAREAASESVKVSREFSELCPASAAVMVLSLES